ncbi:MAG: sulfatase-like hydrolase/transferase [Thermoanaerobaculia bacterium]|jgi:arylsulfatase A-like enzyme/tetratricopeptide (TPR) repeat protein|nr:sulfatase-like hydrolase/transferase [Thermoanaerobaculia bacterium]
MARKGGGRGGLARASTDAARSLNRESSRRRRCIVAATAAIFGAAGLLAIGYRLLSGPRQAPIILVSIDTLRADHLPAYGYTKIPTPAIDELARNGVVFENCYTHVPLTLPAHASLLTGLLPPDHGVRNNIGFRVAEGTPTLASELKRVGYATGGAISAAVLRRGTGIAQGFDWYDDDLRAEGPEVRTTEVQRDGSETLERALSWLRERANASSGEPPFLFFHIFEPHTPYAPPARYRRAGVSPYDGEVMYADEIVGRLFDELRRLDLFERSLIVLLSDHGEGLGDHGEADHGVLLYREVMRVPFIVKLPGQEGGGRRVNDPVQLVDLNPTLREWVGLPPRPEQRGTSLLATLRGGPAPGDRRVYGESLYGRLHFGWKELFSLTDSRFKLILAPRPELYDVEKDALERHDLLAGGSPGVEASTERDRLHRALRVLIGSGAPKAPNPVDEEEVARLRALGYVGSPTLDPTEDATAPDPKDRIGDLALFRKAMRLKGVGMYRPASEDLEKVAASSPRMVDAWDELGGIYRRLGQAEKAVDAFRSGLAVAPSRGEAHLALADFLVELGRLDEARREADTAAPYRPGEAEVRRAVIEATAGDPAAARASALRATNALPAAAPFVDGLLAHAREEYATAVPLLEKALDAVKGRSPRTLPRVHYLLGSALVEQSVHVSDEASRTRLRQEAERHLRTELALEPTSAGAVTALCRVHALAGAPEKLRRDLEAFARGNPSPAVFRLAETIFGQAGLKDDAARWGLRARASAGRSRPALPAIAPGR